MRHFVVSSAVCLLFGCAAGRSGEEAGSGKPAERKQVVPSPIEFPAEVDPEPYPPPGSDNPGPPMERPADPQPPRR